MTYFRASIIYIVCFIVSMIMLVIVIIEKNDKFQKDAIADTKQYYSDYFQSIYDDDKSYFNFNSNNESIITVDKFNSGYKGHYYFVSKINDDFEQCLGYFVIKEGNNKIEVDSSHICDNND